MQTNERDEVGGEIRLRRRKRVPACLSAKARSSTSALNGSLTAIDEWFSRVLRICIAGALLFALLFVGVPGAIAIQVNSITVNNITNTNSTINVIEGTTGLATFNGDGVRVNTISLAGGGTYAPAISGQVIARRNTTAPGTFPDNGPWSPTWHYVGNDNDDDVTNDDLYWGDGTLANYDQIFNSGNLLTGAENLFVNGGNADGSGNITDPASNIERVDFVFGGGFQVGGSAGFTVFERGSPETTNGGHGQFYVALILSVAGDGTTPTAISRLQVFGGNSGYGNGLLGPGVNGSGLNLDFNDSDEVAGDGDTDNTADTNFQYSIFQQATNGSENTARNNRQGSAETGVGSGGGGATGGGQDIAGVFIPSTGFNYYVNGSAIANNTTIYGYMLFGTDTVIMPTGTNNTTTRTAHMNLLLNVDSNAYPKNTQPGTFGTGAEDMDMVASGAFVYKLVPEPSTACGALALLFAVASNRSRKPAAGRTSRRRG